MGRRVWCALVLAVGLAVSAYAAPPAEIVKSAAVTLDATQVQQLPSSPAVLVVAPGPGKVIVPLFALAYLHWQSNFGNIAPTAALAITHNNGYNLLTALFESFGTGVSNLLVDDEDYFALFQPLSDIAPTIGNVASYRWATAFVNQPLTLTAYNGANGNFTDGDGNTLTVTVVYVVVNTTTGAAK